MKKQYNIEQEFERIKDAYRVPEAYFEQITVPKTQPAKRININRIKTYLVAAMILILVTLSYKVLYWQQNKTQITEKTATEITKNDKIFDDLSDDEIIEYLTDQDITELNL